MSALTYQALRVRMQVVGQAMDDACAVCWASSRRTPEYMEWKLIAQACSRESRRLHRMWRNLGLMGLTHTTKGTEYERAR